MGTTPTYSWPYPEPTDPVANGAQDIEDLALAVESTVSGITGGKILQVVSTTKTDTFSATSATFTDVTGLSATITPTSASSTIHVLVTATGNGTVGSTVMHLRVTRGGTAILVGDAAGSRTQASVGGIYEDAGYQGSMPYTVSGIDSPATTSSTTYAVQVRNQGAGTVHINRGSNDTNNAGYPRTVSTITLMEVSA